MVYGLCVHTVATNICVFRYEMNNRSKYITSPQQRYIVQLLTFICPCVCLCQTFNWQPYQITGSLLHRRSLEKSSLNYGPNGKSKGSGEVIFYNAGRFGCHRGEYSGMKLDGRELQLEIIAASNVGLAPLPIQARLSGRGASKVPQRVPLGRGSRAAAHGNRGRSRERNGW